MLVDTHAHIHFRDYEHYEGYPDLDEVLQRAEAAGVGKLLAVGVDHNDSALAVKLAERDDHIWATVGLHPHDAKLNDEALAAVAKLAEHPRVVGIGECGLDFFKELSPRDDQIKAFKAQINLAQKLDKPMVWHVRDAFNEFFDIVDGYENLRGVVHCFTSTEVNMRKAVDRGFYIALNGIMTFTKDASQLAAAKAVPLDRLVLETDCPFLAPTPHRGKRNEPAFIADTALFLAELRGESFDQLAAATTKNAEALFGI